MAAGAAERTRMVKLAMNDLIAQTLGTAGSVAATARQPLGRGQPIMVRTFFAEKNRQERKDIEPDHGNVRLLFPLAPTPGTANR